MTDASSDPTEPAPTDLLDFPPLPQQSGRGGDGEPPRQDPDDPGSSGASPIRVVSEAEATARLRIMLPTQAPTPSTALRPQHVWEDTHTTDVPEAEAFAQVAASPASPSTLPSQLAAMTLATMVIPLPPSVRPGSGLLTTTLPPDQAAQANAAQIGDAFRDTIEEIFGVDLETVDPAEIGLAPRSERPDQLPAADYASDYEAEYEPEYDADVSGSYPLPAGSGYGAEELADQAFPPIAPPPAPMPFPRPVPAEVFGGAYGVPTAPAPLGGVIEPADPFGHQRGIADPHRHALALRYLGGIFHDSSGESSFLDPEEIDQGWIPSAFGAVPPDAPTEQIARITAELPPSPPPASVHSVSAPTIVQPAVEATTVLPAQQPAAEPAHGRSGSRRGTRPPQRQHTDDAAQPKAGQGKRGRTLTVAGLFIAAIVLLYGVALLVAGGVLDGKIPAGVSVDGVNIGGMSQDDARTAIAKQIGPLSTRPIQLLVGQTPVTLDPAKAGLTLDIVQTVASAESQRTDPFSVIPALFGVHHQVDPVIDVDHAALNAALGTIATSYDSPLVEGKITFSGGQPVVTAPQEGRGFDVAAAANAVTSGFLRVSGPIALPINQLTPRATAEALQTALEQIARPAVSGPITIVTGKVSTTLTPTQIGDALTVAPNQAGTMVPILDGDLLRADLDPAALATEQQGVNAGFTVINGQPQLIAEKDGVGYAPQALASAVAGVLTSTSSRSVTVQPGPLPPAFTTADAQALGVQAVLGSATVAIPEATDRDVNTVHATSLVMGSIVQPGAMWSFNKTVGAPTKANGYTESSSGTTDGVDDSGANDLVATAVFDAAFRSGMSDTVHHPNSAYFPRYPVGLDAAVVYPGTDLQWTNSGTHPVYVYASYANGSLTVALLGQTMYDQVSVSVSNQQDVVAANSGQQHYGCPAEPASNGFQVLVTRVLTRGGAQVGTEQFHVTYEPFAGTVCGSSTQSSNSTSGSTGQSGSGTATTAPASGSSGTGGGSGSGGGAPAPTTPAASPTSSGVLGGLLH
ncbi:MAG TPA: VanW family protein [Actinospica sp.]|nr:VanW family protein [Actinospica sp.]